MPFFTYFGGKWRVARQYPEPLYGHIIEPFAGAAGYALRHYTHEVTLVEKDPVLVDLWRYLIAATPKEIRTLPLIGKTQSVDALDICPAARSLIGFWLNKGNTHPCKTPSSWMRQEIRPKSFWGPEIRERVAQQVSQISHWQIIEGDFFTAPDCAATWFIDPPYQNAGKHYRFPAAGIDYTFLSAWCRRRGGQVLVCENDGAAWLPFYPFADIKSTPGRHRTGRSKEVIWTNVGPSTAPRSAAG